MWFFLISSIAGSIIGSATDSWFRDTRLGIWFYNKIDSLYTWASKRYGLKLLTDEKKRMAKFPELNKRLEKTIEKFNRRFENKINFEVFDNLSSHELIHYSDLVIGGLSSLVLESLIYQKPAVRVIHPEHPYLEIAASPGHSSFEGFQVQPCQYSQGHCQCFSIDISCFFGS